MTASDLQRDDEFVLAFWRDVDLGSVAPLDAYLARHPQAEATVRTEYAAWQRAAALQPSDQPAGPSAAGGETIGRYRVRGELARGGMGLLLLAHDPALQRAVVLKTPCARGAPLDSAHRERFAREAQLAGRLVHEAICPVLDVVTQDERTFAVMPLIEGESLADWIARATTMRSGNPAPPATAADPEHPLWAWCAHGELSALLGYLEQVAHAVHFAHEHGVVHRDLKPANLMVRTDGEPVVLDFGLAVDIGSGDARLTHQGDLLGSPLYMAPEQIDGQPGAIDRRTDVYALGVVLYEALTLEAPFTAPSRIALFDAVRRGEPVHPRRRDPRIPRDLEAVCLKAMAPDRRHRYATAHDLAEDLHAVRSLRATRARPISSTVLLARGLRRNARAVVAGVAIAGLLAVVTLLSVRTQRLEHGSRVTQAWVRVLAAMADAVAPATADLELVRAHFPDEQSLAVAMRAGQQKDLPALIDHTTRLLADVLRSADAVAVNAQLRYPRAAVADCRPLFAGTLPPAPASAAYELILRRAGGETWTWALPVRADGEFAFELPADLRLAAHDYGWQVQARSAAAPRSAAAFFRVVAPGEPARIRAAMRTTGTAWLDRLICASALLAHDLAADAARELDALPPLPDTASDQLRRALQVAAGKLLHDVTRVRAQAKASLPAAR